MKSFFLIIEMYFFSKPFPRNKNNFKVGMLLEGNDPKNPSLICVLSVSEIQGYRIRLHFEGYDTCYDFWRNSDSKFIYPPGYCEKNGIKIMPPYGNLSPFFKSEYNNLFYSLLF